MTTPAVNIWLQPPEGFTWWRCSNGGGSFPNPSCIQADWPAWQYLRWEARPESGTSELRADGTRAPRAWSHEWGYVTAGFGRSVITFRDTGDVAFVVTGRLWSTTAGQVGDYLARAGAQWTWTDVALHFPIGTKNAAKVKLANKLTSTNPTVRDSDTFAFGETLGEAHQSARFIGDALTAIWDFAANIAKQSTLETKQVIYFLKHGKWHPSVNRKKLTKYGNYLGRIPSLWLAYQFGLRPLVGDIQASTQALEWLLDDSTPAKFTVKAGHMDERYVTQVFRNIISVIDIQEETRTRSYAWYSCTYEVSVQRDRTLAQLGLNNSFEVLYNLSPWSWALDYLIDVGGYLHALFANSGLRFLEGAESLKQECVSVDTRPDPNTPDYKWVEFPKSATVTDCGRFKRNVLLVHPVPVWPVWKNKLDLRRLANLLAAFSQAIR